MRWRQSFLAAVSRQAVFMPGAFGAGGVDAEPGSTIPATTHHLLLITHLARRSLGVGGLLEHEGSTAEAAELDGSSAWAYSWASE